MKYIAIEEAELAKIEERLASLESLLNQLLEDKIQSRWLTSKEVAKLLHISPRTLQDYRNQRLIPFSKINNKIYYPLAGIFQFLEENVVD